MVRFSKLPARFYLFVYWIKAFFIKKIGKFESEIHAAPGKTCGAYIPFPTNRLWNRAYRFLRSWYLIFCQHSNKNSWLNWLVCFVKTQTVWVFFAHVNFFVIGGEYVTRLIRKVKFTFRYSSFRKWERKPHFWEFYLYSNVGTNNNK